MGTYSSGESEPSAGSEIKPGACSDCDTQGQTVKIRTIKQWLITSLVPDVPELSFCFCRTKECSTVYFSEDNSVQYKKEQLRYRVGLKESSSPIPLCYCFGVTDEMILKEIKKTGKSSFSTWIAAETKKGNCACDVRNPTGRCCLAEVKSVEKTNIKAERRERERESNLSIVKG